MSLGKLAILDMPVPKVSLTGGCVLMLATEDPYSPLPSLGLGPWELLSPSKEPDYPAINCVTWVAMVCMAFRLAMTTSPFRV